jgi:CRP-like cAMP-binding protein
LRNDPEVSASIHRQLAGLVRSLTERVFEFSTLAVKNRVHAELLRLARDHMEGENTAVISPLPTHAQIAARVSTHREAVTRELNALERSGLIERRGGTLIIPDFARLARTVEEVLGE